MPLSRQVNSASQVTPALIIFDCDGVLVDSEGLQAEVFAAALTAVGIEYSSEHCLRSFTGLALGACFELIEAETGRPLPHDFHPRLSEQTRAAFAARLQPVAGADQVLRALQAAAIPFAVASNGSLEKMRFSLTCVGLWPLVSEHAFSADGLAPKPAPDVFLAAASAMGADAASIWVVEDSAAGLEAARRAGMRALQLDAAATGPDCLRQLPDLLALLPLS